VAATASYRATARFCFHRMRLPATAEAVCLYTHRTYYYYLSLGIIIPQQIVVVYAERHTGAQPFDERVTILIRIRFASATWFPLPGSGRPGHWPRRTTSAPKNGDGAHKNIPFPAAAERLSGPPRTSWGWTRQVIRPTPPQTFTTAGRHSYNNMIMV